MRGYTRVWVWGPLLWEPPEVLILTEWPLGRGLSTFIVSKPLWFLALCSRESLGKTILRGYLRRGTWSDPKCLLSSPSAGSVVNHSLCRYQTLLSPLFSHQRCWPIFLSLITNQPRLKYNILSNLHSQVSQINVSVLDSQVTACPRDLVAVSYAVFQLRTLFFPSPTMRASVWLQSLVSLLLPATAEISLEISHPHICPGLLNKLELEGSLHKILYQTVCKNKTSQSRRRMTEEIKHWWNEWPVKGEVS